VLVQFIPFLTCQLRDDQNGLDLLILPSIGKFFRRTIFIISIVL